MKALLFDCDGVIVDTERDGHRIAFNLAFEKDGVPAVWDEGLYGELLRVAGGKERMKHFFDDHGWPERLTDRDESIRRLHLLKTDLFMKIIAGGGLPLRPGVARLVDEALEADIPVGVCSTSNERAVNLVVNRMLGAERKSQMAFILAGDVVSRKKPDPEIYNLAAERLSLTPEACLVVEDSRNGLLSAKRAGMKCLVTKSTYTGHEDFSEADHVVDELGEPPGSFITLAQLLELGL